jgi:succinate dehydrogenase hydrophobic anchor subunit
VTPVDAETSERTPFATQTRVWRWTAFTGIALLVLVTIHMIAHHFVVESIGGLRTYRQILDYIANPVMFTIECTFLVVVTIHAMLGLRGVLFDLNFGARARTRINRGLVALGALTIAYGLALIGTLASRA